MRLLRPLFSGLVMLIGLTSPGVVWATDLVIIAAEQAGSALAPGKTLKAGSSITLSAGGRVTILAQSGEIIKLKGPYSGPVQAQSAGQGQRQATGQLAAVSQLVAPSRRSTTLGATRSTNTSGRDRKAPSNIWIIEADRAGAVCARAEGLMLWRPAANNPATIALWPPSGAPKKIDWAAGASTQRIGEQPLVNGTQLSILSGGRNTALVVSIVPKEIDPSPNGRLLQWMAARGCRGQVQKLVRMLHGDG